MCISDINQSEIMSEGKYRTQVLGNIADYFVKVKVGR